MLSGCWRLCVGFVLATLVFSSAPAHAATKSAEKVFGEPRPDQALVYLIRTRNRVASPSTLFLYADQSFLGVIDNDCYTFAYLDSGPYLFWPSRATVTDNVDLEGGRSYYFDVGFYISGWDKEVDLQWVSEEVGKSLIEEVTSYCTPSEKELATSERHIRSRYEKARKTEERDFSMSGWKKELLVRKPHPIPRDQVSENRKQLGSGATLTVQYKSPGFMKLFRCLVDGKVVIDRNGISNIMESLQIKPGRHKLEIFLQSEWGEFTKHKIDVPLEPGSSHTVSIKGGHMSKGKLRLDGVKDPPSYEVIPGERPPARESYDRADSEIRESLNALGSGSTLKLRFKTPPGPMKLFRLLVDRILVFDTDGNTDLEKDLDIGPGHPELGIILQNASTREIEKLRVTVSLEPGGSHTVSIENGYWHKANVRLDGAVVSPDSTRTSERSPETGIDSILDATQVREDVTEGHRKAVYTVAFSPDGTILAAAGEHATVNFWDVDTGKVIRTLEGHTRAVFSVAFAPDGESLSSGSHDGSIVVWEVVSGRIIRRLVHGAPVSSVRFSPDGMSVASGGLDGRVLIWDVNSGNITFTLPIISYEPWRPVYLEFSPDGKLLATSGPWGIKMWDPMTGKMRYKLKRGLYRPMPTIDFAPDGETIAGVKLERTEFAGETLNVPLKMTWWDVKSRKLTRVLHHDQPICVIVHSPDGKLLAAGSPDGTVTLWDLETGQIRRTVEMRTGWMDAFAQRFDAFRGALAFSPDGRLLAGGGEGGRIDLRDVETGEVKPLHIGESSSPSSADHP